MLQRGALSSFSITVFSLPKCSPRVVDGRRARAPGSHGLWSEGHAASEAWAAQPPRIEREHYRPRPRPPSARYTDLHALEQKVGVMPPSARGQIGSSQ